MDEKAKLSFRCLDALQLLPRGEEIVKTLEEEMKCIQGQSFIHVLNRKPLLFVKIQTLHHFRFLVLQRNKSRHWMLKYDGRHLKQFNDSTPLEIWLLDEHGHLMEKKQSMTDMPRLHSRNYRNIPKAVPLWTLLNLPEPEPDPTSYDETVEFLMTHNQHDLVNVSFILAPGYGFKMYNWNCVEKHQKNVGVFTNENYNLCFTTLLASKRRGKPRKDTNEKVTSVEHHIDSDRQANKSSAVSVKLTGLNLALCLGCISQEQFSYISAQLGKCYLAMWMEFDDAFQVRFVNIYREKMLLQIEIKNEHCWEKVFAVIEKEKDLLKTKKTQLLLPLIEKLQILSQNTSSFYQKCEMQLQSFIKDLKIIVFSPDDTALHGIKLPFANYLKTKYGKKFRGLILNGDAKNDLVLIKYTGIAMFNLNIYLNSDVIPSDISVAPLLKHDIKTFNNHAKQNNVTVFKQCKQRGHVIAPRLLEMWQTIGQFFMQQFQYDIFSNLSMSLSKLSHDTIWSTYCKRGGIFHHALEKTKIAYEKTLRSFSNGGFSYSARDKLNVGEPIHGTHGQPAQTLCELDLISSYGYAGSHISVPKGFCTGFVNDGNGNLICTEPFQRFHSFEFLAVYFTLWTLVNQRVSIKTVYSNFHQAGVFYIGHYPIDLVIVTNSGAIIMYQFDGHYAHGCSQGCKSISSYIHGKSRYELEKKTADRNDYLFIWANKVNFVKPGTVTFVIKTSCHDQDYFMSTLLNAFQHISTLNNLLQGYFTKKVITTQDVLSCSDDVMYIMIAEGYLSSPNSPKALLLLKNKKWSRETLNLGQPMMFTKDYADWLRNTFDFQFTTIHKVFFFKKCTLLNVIYKELTLLRMSPNLLPSTKQLIKMILNYSAGYFGMNQNGKTVAKYKIVSNVTKRKYNIVNHKLDPIQGSFNHDFYVKTVYKPSSKKHRMSLTGVPIFCCIVEFGKLRMAQVLCLFDTCLSPSSYRHLYTNVDNVVFALSTSNLMDAVQPHMKAIFNEAKQTFFQPNTPGHLKEEFLIESHQRWKFVTAAIMNYVIIADSFSVQKNCALNNMSFTDAYNASLALLNNEILVVKQDRRINKMANKNVQTMTLTFNPSHV